MTQDQIFEMADRIELVMEAKPVDTMWSPSELAGPLKAETADVRATLEWMEAQVYVTTNGRGGCWRRYGRRY
jgi:hypothetical protein